MFKGLNCENIEFAILTVHTKDGVQKFRVTKDEISLLCNYACPNNNEEFFYDVDGQGD